MAYLDHQIRLAGLNLGSAKASGTTETVQRVGKPSSIEHHRSSPEHCSSRINFTKWPHGNQTLTKFRR
jgi:hypothetical protein